MKKSRLPFSILLGALVFFYAPLAVLSALSFNDNYGMHWTGFSLRWYEELFRNQPDLWLAFGNSLIVALSAGLAATIIAAFGAVGLAWSRFRFRQAILGLTFLPMVLPEIILGVSLLLLFNFSHVPLSLFTVFLAHSTFCLPFAYLVTAARLESFDRSLLEAARDLGANRWQAFQKVALPLLGPGLGAAFLLSVTLSLEDFVITFFVAGPGSSTLAVHVYSMVRFGVSPVVNALSVLLLVGTAVLAFFSRGAIKNLA